MLGEGLKGLSFALCMQPSHFHKPRGGKLQTDKDMYRLLKALQKPELTVLGTTVIIQRCSWN